MKAKDLAPQLANKVITKGEYDLLATITPSVLMLSRNIFLRLSTNNMPVSSINFA